MTETSGLHRARSLTSLVILIVAVMLMATQPRRAQSQRPQASSNVPNVPFSPNTVPSANAPAVVSATSRAVVATQPASDSIPSGTTITMQNLACTPKTQPILR
jgi:hypothetical protein